MEKRVTLQVGLILKEMGYPQDNDEICYFDDDMNILCKSPRYLDVWAWLWKEKDIKIMPKNKGYTIKARKITLDFKSTSNDVEEYIIHGIEFLFNTEFFK